MSIVHEMQVVVQEQKRHRGNPKLGVSLPYSVVREAIKPHNFKNIKQYQDWVRENNPEGFPLQPRMTYTRKNEWISRQHFLGKTEDITPEVIAQEDKTIETPIALKGLRRIISQILGLRK
jgi:hypothetical protein